MNNPGVFTLAVEQIGAAAAKALTPIASLDGMTAVTLVAQLAFGSGGTTCIAVVQTSFDDGVTWYDVARFDFATTAAVKRANVEGLLSVAVSAYASLGSEGVNDGFLGDRLRAVITSTGTYVNTVLSIRAAVR